MEEQGQIHVLVNNAGIVSTVPFEEISQEEWDRIVAINLTGVYAALQVVYPAMKEAGYGRIVNTASVDRFEQGNRERRCEIWYRV